MGICSRRHFLLTICSLQLLTTIERQVFDFLGFMWAPILVNFFNIIFVILGFFGAFQYRPKYIISYCVWNTLWLGWNIFAICFYLDVGILDKNSDVLNFGTGSFSWWQTNGPGCKIVNEITEPEIYRPSRPTNVTDCVLGYEVIEVMHASTQCILGLMAIVGGICLSRVFLEEDDSFDFVGGDDFGLAGHTPLHPMYVSYSALSPSVYTTVNSSKSLNRSFLGSQRSFSMNEQNSSSILKFSKNENSLDIANRIADNRQYKSSNLTIDDISRIARNDEANNEISYNFTRSLSICEENDNNDETSLTHVDKRKFRKNEKLQNSTITSTSRYSPVVSPRMRRSRISSSTINSRTIDKNTSNKRRFFIDHVREQPLRSFYSDPRLSNVRQCENKNISNRDSRPLSLCGNNS